MRKTVALVFTLLIGSFGFSQDRFQEQEPEVNNNLEIQFIDPAGNPLIVTTPRQAGKPGSRKVAIERFLKADYRVVFRDRTNPKAGDYKALSFKMVITPPGEKPYQYTVTGDKINPDFLRGITVGYKVSIVAVKVKGPDGKTYISQAGYTLSLV